MSELLHSKNTLCENCGSDKIEQFCAHCGQENKDLKEPFWAFFTELFSNLFHFDSKVLASVRVLFSKPGELTRVFLQGKRKLYVHPIRFYFFIIFVYLLIMAVTGNDKALVTHSNNENVKDDYKSGLNVYSVHVINEMVSDTTVEQYKASQLKRAPADRDGYFKNIWQRFVIKNYLLGKDDVKLERISDVYLHNMSKLLFFLLPLYALLLYLFFRKEHLYFIEHAIFSIHLHIFAFLLIMLLILVNYAFAMLPGNIHRGYQYFETEQKYFVFGSVFLYSFLAGHRVYGESWTRTFLKFIGVNGIYAISYVMGTIINISMAIMSS